MPRSITRSCRLSWNSAPGSGDRPRRRSTRPIRKRLGTDWERWPDHLCLGGKLALAGRPIQDETGAMNELDQHRQTALAAIAGAATLDALDAERVAALGKKGWVSLALKTLGQMSPDERQQVAPAIQAIRAEVRS